MKIIDRMFSTMESKSLKSADLARVLEIRSSVISTWKSRGTNPPVEYTVRICEFLGVSLEYYLTGIEKQSTSIDDLSICEKYQALRKEDQEEVNAIINMKYNRAFSTATTASAPNNEPVGTNNINA
ncbi:MAG: helix-turn-helix domain-containing protein [Anaerovoracaceae bacterium]